jgi:formate-dependent phosphoribosylglycinamide formyltransferase (GAR transformylase)
MPLKGAWEVIVEAFVKFNSDYLINRGAKQQSNLILCPIGHRQNAGTIRKLAASFNFRQDLYGTKTWPKKVTEALVELDFWSGIFSG